jgi:hypothetical protein
MWENLHGRVYVFENRNPVNHAFYKLDLICNVSNDAVVVVGCLLLIDCVCYL